MFQSLCKIKRDKDHSKAKAIMIWERKHRNLRWQGSHPKPAGYGGGIASHFRQESGNQTRLKHPGEEFSTEHY